MCWCADSARCCRLVFHAIGAPQSPPPPRLRPHFRAAPKAAPAKPAMAGGANALFGELSKGLAVTSGLKKARFSPTSIELWSV